MIAAPVACVICNGEATDVAIAAIGPWRPRGGGATVELRHLTFRRERSCAMARHHPFLAGLLATVLSVGAGLIFWPARRKGITLGSRSQGGRHAPQT